MKKVICCLVFLMITFAAATTSFASGTNNSGDLSNNLDPEQLAIDLVEFDKRNNTHSFIINDVDPDKIKLKFDTLEEYEKFINSIVIIPEEGSTVDKFAIESTALTNDFAAMDGILAASTLQKSIYRDAKIYGSGIYLGKLRNKVVVNYYFNATYNRYRFSSWVSQSSYPTGTVFFSWDQDYETHSIVDNQRTLLSTVNGHLTVGAIVGGIYIGTMEVENLLYSYGYTML